MKVEGVMTVQVTKIVECTEADLATFLSRKEACEARTVLDFMKEYNADDVKVGIQYFAHEEEGGAE